MKNILSLINERKLILFLSFFFVFIKTHAQESLPMAFSGRPDNDMFYTTPDVMAFQKYNFLPVDLYTGRVNVSIPIYTINTGDITVPVDISYNAGNGVKVDDIASSVGLGWTLNAGGNITKNIKGISDFAFDMSVYSEQDWDHGCILHVYAYQKGYHRNYNEICRCANGLGGGSFSCPIAVAEVGNDGTNEDASPDEYMVHAPMLNTQFYTEKINASDTYFKGVPLDGTPLKINGTVFDMEYIVVDPKNNSVIRKRDFNNFTVTNTNGVTYYFDVYDQSHTTHKVTKLKEFDYTIEIPTVHLSRISDSKGRNVYFEYEVYAKPKEAFKYYTQSVFKERANPDNLNSFWKNACTYAFIPKYDTYTQQDEPYFKASVVEVSFTKAHRLKTIRWEEGSIDFSYYDRQDSNHEKALGTISIKNKKNEWLKQYSLLYTYIKSKDSGPVEEVSRMTLTGINLLSHDLTLQKQYSFEYNPTPLPKRKSLEQDYLGYYNHNGINTPAMTSLDVVSPTLYYYPNQGKHSILPFPLQGNTYGYTLPGNYSLLPNETYSQAGILTKIIYPTGGWSEFEYENHRFTFLSKEYIAPGVRLKKQKINNGEGQVYEYTYSYENGSIGNIPTYGYPWAVDFDKAQDNVSFVIYDKLKSGLELTNGSFIGYSKVYEKQNGNGSKVYQYTNFSDSLNEYEEIVNTQQNPKCINFLNNSSSYFQQNYLNTDLKRGRLIHEWVYNEGNKLIQEKKSIYEYKLLNEIQINFDKTYSYFVDNSIPSAAPPNYSVGMKNRLKIHRNLLKSIEASEYLENGTITNISEYKYHPVYPFLYEEIKEGEKVNDKLITRYKYPLDLPGKPFSGDLVNQNRISTPLVTETLKKENNTEKQISLTETEYAKDASTAQFILPKFLYSKKGESVSEKKITYDKYDSRGNLLQYTPENGIPVSVIWGYNGQYPVAKIEGIGYDSMLNGGGNIKDIVTAIQDQTSVYPENQEFHLNLMNQLRVNAVLKEVMVTTYTYQPLVGVTTITQPNGMMEYYEYDSFGRLKAVKDQDKKILKAYKYYYKR